MKKLQVIALALIFAISSSSFMLAEKKIVSKATQKRHEAAKRAANSAQVAQKSIAGLTGQALVDALRTRNMALSADIATHQAHIKNINKNRGKQLVIKGGKSVWRLRPRTKQQKAEENMNLHQISLDTQEINRNNVKIAAAQKGLALASVAQAKSAFISFLQQNNGNSGQIPADLQAALTAFQTAAYNQGKFDQYAIDAPAIQNSYNQGFSDGQNGVANSAYGSPADASTPDSLNSSNVCDDSSTPNATTGLCADGSQPTTVGDATSAGYVSSCPDGVDATCADGTNLALAICSDGNAPDINGMCPDGSFVLCDDGTSSPLCDDGSTPQ